MGAVDGLPIPASLMPDHPAGSVRRDPGPRDTHRPSGHRIAATVVALGVLLCMSWTNALHPLSGFAVRDDHVIATAVQGRPAGANAGGRTCGTAVLRSRHTARPRRRLAQVVLTAYHQSRMAASGSGAVAPGRGGLSPAAGIACRPAGGWFLASYRTVVSWLLAGHDRDGKPVLAARRWMAGRPGQLAVGCAASEDGGPALRLDAAVLEPASHRTVRLPDADAGLRAGLRTGRSRQSLAGLAGPICISQTSRPGGGAGIAHRWCSISGGSGGPVGSADRASLPGRSTRYRVIWLVCPQCGATMTCLFYDEGDAPLCQDSAHGQMEIRR